jgi:hypothetical protein
MGNYSKDWQPISSEGLGTIVARKIAVFRTHSILVAMILINWSVQAGVGLEGVVSKGQQDQIDSMPMTNTLKREEEGFASGHSVAPVVGYEPVFKFVYGAAYFYQDRDFSLGVDVNSNFQKVYQLHSSTSVRFHPSWEAGYKIAVTKGFDSYFGEGGETNPNDFVRLWGVRSINRFYLAYKPSDIFSFGPFVDYRVHTEEPAGAPTPFSRVAPDDQSIGVGLFQKIDTVSTRKEVTDGFILNTLFTHVPTKQVRPGFSQLEAEFIVYKEILEGHIPGVVAAFHLMSGMSFGKPNYIYKYRLGGSGTMRGYLENRFRGEKYYAQQTELRFPIWKFLSGGAFLGFGDATDSAFTNAKMAYGGGLRIGLPPDYVSKIRIDAGFGRDSQGIYADFGQAF